MYVRMYVCGYVVLNSILKWKIRAWSHREAGHFSCAPAVTANTTDGKSAKNWPARDTFIAILLSVCNFFGARGRLQYNYRHIR